MPKRKAAKKQPEKIEIVKEVPEICGHQILLRQENGTFMCEKCLGILMFTRPAPSLFFGKPEEKK